MNELQQYTAWLIKKIIEEQSNLSVTVSYNDNGTSDCMDNATGEILFYSVPGQPLRDAFERWTDDVWDEYGIIPS